MIPLLFPWESSSDQTVPTLHGHPQVTSGPVPLPKFIAPSNHPLTFWLREARPLPQSPKGGSGRASRLQDKLSFELLSKLLNISVT